MTRRLVSAAYMAAAWCAVLEVITSAQRGSDHLARIGLATLWLSLLVLFAAVLVTVLAWPIARSLPGAAFAARSPRARLVFALGKLAGSIALHFANATLYVRLYEPIHAALSVATLLGAFAGFAWLDGLAAYSSAPATSRYKPSHLALIQVGLCTVLATLSTIAIAIDPGVRADALERTTILARELRALDSFTGILEIEPLTSEQQAKLDPAIWAAVQPRGVTQPSGLARGSHVVLVTIDSMRSDRWLAGGAPSPLMPALEDLAKDATRFSRAYAPSCWTVHSMSAVLWGRLPSQLRFKPVGVDAQLNMIPFDDDVASNPLNFKKATPVPYADQGPGLIDALRAGGYETATIAGYAFYLRGAGVTRAFEHVDETSYRALGPGKTGLPHVPMVERASAFLDARDKARPFLLWLHFMEPHAPYEARDPSAEGKDAIARYDSELRYVDAQIGALRQALDARGLSDDTLWIAHADHGEEFRDHGGEFHATTLYEEIVHVPLLVRMPPKLHVAPRTIETPVGLLDLGPTLLDALGVPSAHAFMGRSLLPAITTGQGADRPQLMECDRFAARKRAYLRWPFKLIVDRAVGTAELFALPADPQERENLAAREPALLQGLTVELEQLHRSLTAVQTKR